MVQAAVAEYWAYPSSTPAYKCCHRVLSPPSSSPPSPSRALYTPCGCLCTGWRLRRLRGIRCSGRSVSCGAKCQLPSPIPTNPASCPSHHSPLYTGQHGCDVVCRTPSVLEDVEAELARGVDVRMEHLADELDRRRLVGVLLLEVHHEPKGSVFEGGIRGADDNSVPDGARVSRCASSAMSRGQLLTKS